MRPACHRERNRSLNSDDASLTGRSNLRFFVRFRRNYFLMVANHRYRVARACMKWISPPRSTEFKYWIDWGEEDGKNNHNFFLGSSSSPTLSVIMHLSELLCKMSEIVPAAQSTLSFLRCSGAVRISHLWRHAAAARRLMMMMITDSQNLSSCSKDEFVCGSSFTLSSYHLDNSDFYASGTKICTNWLVYFASIDIVAGFCIRKSSSLPCG